MRRVTTNAVRIIWLVLRLSFSSANIMPEFDPNESTVIIKIQEGSDTPEGTVIHKFKGRDSDRDTLTFSLNNDSSSSSDISPFKLDRTSKTEANLVLGKELDREQVSNYNLQVLLHDGRATKSATQNILVIVMDTNDNYPKFDRFESAFKIKENSDVPLVISNFHATDNDEGPNGEVNYSLKFLNASDKILFELKPMDNGTVELWLISPLDFENKRTHILQLVALDNPLSSSEGPTVPAIPNETVVSITINVFDVSDNVPVFSKMNKDMPEIPENAPLNSEVVQVHARDGDSAVNNSIYYELLSEQDKFYVGSSSGIIRTKFRFSMDYSLVGIYKLLVRATEEESGMTSLENATYAEIEVFVNVTAVWSSPHFENDSYVGQIPENSPPGYPVVMKSEYVTEVFDNDKGGRDMIRMSVVEGDVQDTFEVLPREGYGRVMFQVVVKNGGKLDYEIQQEIDFHLIAEDSAGNRTKVHVSVFITDQNDNQPIFSSSPYFVLLPENPPEGLIIAKISAKDIDSGLYGDHGLRYVNLKGLAKQVLHLDEVSGEIKVVTNREIGGGNHTSVFDREKYPEIYMTAEVRDDNGKGNSNMVMIVIQLKDVNDNRPQFSQEFYETEIYENLSNVTLALRISAFDSDQPYTNNSKIEYTLVNISGNRSSKASNVSSSGHLSIDPNTGILFLHKSFDFEKIHRPISDLFFLDDFKSVADGKMPFRVPMRFTVEASDLGNPPMVSSVPLTVYVLDRNDCAPEFTQEVYIATIREDHNSLSEPEIVQVKAVDGDASPGYNAIVYKINEDDARIFDIDSKSGVITLASGNHFDWNAQSEYTLQVSCADEMNLKSKRDAVVRVTILDVNNKPPKFTGGLLEPKLDTCHCNGNITFEAPSKYVVSIPEGTPAGVNVTMVTASDPDSNADLRYRINYHSAKNGKNLGEDFIDLEKYLVIDTITGIITTGSVPFDLELVDRLKVEVTVEDTAGEVNTPQLDTTWLYIEFTSKNNLKPQFLRPEYHVVIMEDVPVGTKVVTMNADGNAEDVRIEYSIVKSQNALPLGIDNELGVIRVIGEIDREANDMYNFTIRATSTLNLSSDVKVFIKVDDENDNEPFFSDGDTPQNFSVEESSFIGSVIGRVSAIDLDADSNGQVTYILDGGDSFQEKFAIDPSSGIITLSGLIDREHKDSYKLVVKAVDNFNSSSSGKSHSVIKLVQVQVIDVNDNQPKFHFHRYRKSDMGGDDDGNNNLHVVFENATENFTIFSFYVTDDDQVDTPNSAVNVQIKTIDNKEQIKPVLFHVVNSNNEKSTNDTKLFSWKLLTTQPLHGQIGNKTVILEAEELGTPSNKVIEHVTIWIKPSSDKRGHQQECQEYRFAKAHFIAKYTPGYLPETEILQVALLRRFNYGSDSDSLEFSLETLEIEGKETEEIILFSVHPKTGVVSVALEVTNETHTKSYYRFRITATWKTEFGSIRSTSANLTIFRVSNLQSITLLTKLSVLELESENENARKESYFLGKKLEKMFGLLVTVDPAIIISSEDSLLSFCISFVCPKTYQVLEKHEIQKIFGYVPLHDIYSIFDQLQIILDTDEAYGDTSEKNLKSSVMTFIFGNNGGNLIDFYGDIFYFENSEALYLYYVIFIGCYLMFFVIITGVTLFCKILFLSKCCRQVPKSVQCKKVVLLRSEHLSNDKKLFMVQLDTLGVTPIESDC